MDCSEEISSVVAKSMELLAQRHEDRSEIDLHDLLRRTVKLLCSSEGYTDHLKVDLANDFAFLPNEIVHDTVETALAEEGCVEHLKNLALLAGSWAEFGNVAADWRLPFTKVDSKTNCEQLRAIAPSLYEEIEFSNVPSTIYGTLGLMGTRFSKVKWRQEGKGSLPVISLPLMDFFKRQLKSNYLREFWLLGELKTKELTELFVEFVKKPQFRCLGSLVWLPFEAFEELHKAWEASDCVEFTRKRIEAKISLKTAKKIEQYFETTLTGYWTIIERKHPVRSTAKMIMAIDIIEEDDTVLYCTVVMRFRES